MMEIAGMEGSEQEQPLRDLENIQFIPHDQSGNHVPIKMEYSPQNLFHSNGTFRIVGYGTPQERHSTSEIAINTPIKSKFQPRLTAVNHATPHQYENVYSQFLLHDLEPLGSPVYAKVQDENVKVRRRGAKLPQALPLQKVSKRKASHIDPTEWDLDENDEEVLILMDGVLTKVGKPSGPTSSGKILSTVQNCPITVKWLLENFESMVGQSLPRSFVYDQYVAHCGLNKIDSVNAASFGKLIRSVFLGLRTRRLGTRGNSKYHYYGIKIKETSHLLPILNSIRAEQDLLNDTVNGRIRKRVRRTQSVYTGKHVKGLVIDKKVEIQENLGPMDYQYPEISITKEPGLPDGIETTSLEIFEDMYKRHCMAVMEFFHGFKLIDVLVETANFWRLSFSFKRKSLENYALLLPKPLLFKLASLEVVEVFVVRMDLYMYQHIINILVPSILRPLPLQMLQAIDNMIQDILGILAIAMSGFPKRLVHGKLRALTAFIRLWKQYSKMSQLSEFVELTLENETSILAMRHNINSNMLEHICDRTTVILESKTMSSEMILRMMTSFAQALKKEQSLDLWCDWASSELFEILKAFPDASFETVELVTADMHSCWLIITNLMVNAIREIYGSESSLFVPLLQWCGELMHYFRQRLLDSMKEVMPVTRFYIALLDEDMSVSFMDKYKAKPLATTTPLVPEDTYPMPLLIPTSVRLLDNKTTMQSENLTDNQNASTELL
ncbi:unnamed protein product [Orchesella dallaii]|uniref:RFX-type winged-helix domain-containing protein n=1 Tax=Orchesella dallaii TaxID=48710 RepID=A0ABP1R1P4_9HEXA